MLAKVWQDETENVKKKRFSDPTEMDPRMQWPMGMIETGGRKI